MPTEILEELLRDILDLKDELLRDIDGLKEELLREIVLLKWLLGGLSFFAALIAGLVIRMGLQMFSWRREIDAAIAENKMQIGIFDEWKTLHIGEAVRTREELRTQREKLMQMSTKIP